MDKLRCKTGMEIFIKGVQKRTNEMRIRRENFAAWLAENAQSEADEMKHERAIRLWSEIEERSGFAFAARLAEEQEEQDAAARKLLLFLIFLLWKSVPQQEKNWLKSGKNKVIDEGGNSYEFN